MGPSPGSTLLLALLLVVAGCLSSPSAPGEGEASWEVVDLGGVHHTPQSLRGAPVLLFFMATWCSSCKATTDDLAQVNATYAPQGLQVLSVSWDPQEDEQDLARWKTAYDQPWPHGIDPAFRVHQVYGIRSQSSVVVLDAQGSMVETWGYGQADAASMADAVERALAQTEA